MQVIYLTRFTKALCKKILRKDKEIDTIEIEKCNIKHLEMKKVNPDIYAWIYIPGTEIDYPVLQHPSDDSYYLNYNMNGTRGYPGCIYTEKENNKPAFTENGAKVLKYIQENVDAFNNMFKAKDIGEGTMMSSRGASGAMRKLVTDGYLEKIGTDPVIYALTEKGKTVDIEAALN